MSFDSDITITAEERIDEIGFGNLKLIQKPKDFCYGVDAVLLSHFAVKNSKKNPKLIFDLGTGTGILPLILSHKTEAESIIGVEVQQDSYLRAMRNAQINGICDRVAFINDDVKAFRTGWGRELKGTADIVVSNPPYFISGGGIKNDLAPKTIARHETTAKLADFMECAAFLLKPRGEFFMVHRPSRLVDICCSGRKFGLEPKGMCFVSPTIDAAPNILLVHMVKGGGKELKFHKPLAVYDDRGDYSAELLKAYED